MVEYHILWNYNTFLLSYGQNIDKIGYIAKNPEFFRVLTITQPNCIRIPQKWVCDHFGPK